MGAVGAGGVDELAEPALGHGRAEPAAGALDGVVPQRVELLRRIVRGGGELPLIVAAVAAEGQVRGLGAGHGRFRRAVSVSHTGTVAPVKDVLRPGCCIPAGSGPDRRAGRRYGD